MSVLDIKTIASETIDAEIIKEYGSTCSDRNVWIMKEIALKCFMKRNEQKFNRMIKETDDDYDEIERIKAVVAAEALTLYKNRDF